MAAAQQTDKPCLQLEAGRLEASGDAVEAEGEVNLLYGSCQVRALQLKLRTGQGMNLQGMHVRLRSSKGGTRLQAHRLQLSPLDGLRASWVDGSLCGCPGSGAPLLHFSARSAHIAAGGQRLHLKWPTLRIKGRGIFTLPYLALPLAPGVSGLLLPRISYSGRDGLRLEQEVYLAPGRRFDLLLRGGWIQQRGAVAGTRLRYWIDGLGEGNLDLRGWQDQDRYRGALRGRAVLARERWGIGLTPDVVSDKEIPADLEQETGRTFAPYLRSRLWAWSGVGAFFGLGQGDLFQELRAIPARGGDTHGRVALALGLLPVSLAGPLSADLLLGLTHWEAGELFDDADRDGRLDEEERLYQNTSLALAPGLSFYLAPGPFRIRARGAYRLEAAGSPLTEGWRASHFGVVDAEVSLPLARVFHPPVDAGGKGSRWRHELEPLAGLRWGQTGDQGPLLESRPGFLQGTHVLAGLRTALLHRRGDGPVGQVLAAEVRLEWPIMGEGDDPSWRGEPLVGAEAQVTPPGPLRGWARVRWAPQSNTLAQLQAGTCLRWTWLDSCVRYSRLRLQDPRDLFGPWQRPGSWTGGIWQGAQQIAADQLSGTARIRWSVLELGAQIAGDPGAGELTHGVYWGNLVLGCGCYKVGLIVRTRMGQQWPDVLARLSLLGGGSLRCP